MKDDERQRRYDACQTGIRALTDKWEEVAPDACVILGNDQRELFLEDIQPTFTVYRGETFYNQPTSDEQRAKLAPGVADAEWAYRPEHHTVYPGLPDLAEIVFERAMEEGFDLAASSDWLRQRTIAMSARRTRSASSCAGSCATARCPPCRRSPTPSIRRTSRPRGVVSTSAR